MRKVCVYGIDDKTSFDLSRDVDVIVKIMEIGVAEDAITFKVVFSGKELKEFMEDNKLTSVTDSSGEVVFQKIVDKNKYEVKAYDW